MRTISVHKTSEIDSGWSFTVSIEGRTHIVFLEKQYLQKISPNTSPEKFVEKSFQFLLEREPLEAILKEFNIKVINTYFPEFESTLSGGT